MKTKLTTLGLAAISMVCTSTSAFSSDVIAKAPSVDELYKVVSFTPSTFASNPTITIGATESIYLYADFSGIGSLTTVEVPMNLINLTNINITPGTPINLYTASAEDAEKIRWFGISGIKMRKLDASRLTATRSFNIYNTALSQENLQFPQSPNLTELAVVSANMTNTSFMDAYPGLKFVNLTDNKITEFDGSKYPNLENLSIANNQLSTVKFDNPALWDLALAGNNLKEFDFNGLPSLHQIFISNNYLTHIDPTPVLDVLKVLDIQNNDFTFANLPDPNEWSVNVLYYGSQHPLDVECIDHKVDLSSQYNIRGVITEYNWYEGEPVYNPETDEIEGTLLVEGEDYILEDGVTTFLYSPSEDVICMMTNATYPKLVLLTYFINVSGVEDILADNADKVVTAYTLDGRMIGQGRVDEMSSKLTHGIYIIDGKKIKF